MGIAKDMMRMPQYTLNTFATAAQWCEGFLNRLSVAIKVGSLLEPRELYHFCVEDVQTLGSTMLVEMRMREDELRAKQLVIHSSAPKPQAAAQSYEADYWNWTAQEWEEYEAEGAGASDPKGRQAQDKKKICSAYASKDRCPKGAMCYMVAKGGTPKDEGQVLAVRLRGPRVQVMHSTARQGMDSKSCVPTKCTQE
eukprot:961535-Amphidinium_carterae.1